MRLAINAVDLDRHDRFVLGLLLKDKIDLDAGAVPLKGLPLDEMPLPFTCNLLQAACVCDVIRSKDRSLKRYPTRVYVQTRERWNRLPHAAVLVKIRDREPYLNPEFFPKGKCSPEDTTEMDRVYKLRDELERRYRVSFKGGYNGRYGFFIEAPEDFDAPEEWGRPVAEVKGVERYPLDQIFPQEEERPQPAQRKTTPLQGQVVF